MYIMLWGRDEWEKFCQTPAAMVGTCNNISPVAYQFEPYIE